MICRKCARAADDGQRIHQPCDNPGCLCQHGKPYAASHVGDFNTDEWREPAEQDKE